MEIKTHFLYPGALYASKIPTRVTTILGSCVAVCLWDKKLKIGGINHFMLPYWNGRGLASPRYGNIAIVKLYEKMQSFACDDKDIIAKVFGGGEVISSNSNLFQIGKRNIIVANELLRENKIAIVGKSVGGKFGRKIIFNTETGEVMQRFINSEIK